MKLYFCVDRYIVAINEKDATLKWIGENIKESLNTDIEKLPILEGQKGSYSNPIIIKPILIEDPQDQAPDADKSSEIGEAF